MKHQFNFVLELKSIFFSSCLLYWKRSYPRLIVDQISQSYPFNDLMCFWFAYGSSEGPEGRAEVWAGISQQSLETHRYRMGCCCWAGTDGLIAERVDKGLLSCSMTLLGRNVLCNWEMGIFLSMIFRDISEGISPWNPWELCNTLVRAHCSLNIWPLI